MNLCAPNERTAVLPAGLRRRTTVTTSCSRAGLGRKCGPGPGRLVAVDDVGFEVPAGGSLGIVGESGSGKSLTLRALMALLPPAARAERGVVELAGEPLPLSGPDARKARRRRLAMVFQDPLSGLDPVKTVGVQVAEVPRRVLGRIRAQPAGGERSSCWGWSACPTQNGTRARSRTSCREACANEW